MDKQKCSKGNGDRKRPDFFDVKDEFSIKEDMD